MIKAIQLAGLFIFFVFTTVYGQKMTEWSTQSEGFKAMRMGYRDGHEYYHEQMQAGNGTLNKQVYYDVDLNTGLVKKYDVGQISDDKYKGFIVRNFVNQNYMYELIQFTRSMNPRNCKVGVIKRSLDDFTPVGDIVWIGEYDQVSALDVPRVAMYNAKDGIFVLSIDPDHIEKKLFLKRFDLEMKEKWTTPMDVHGEGVKFQNLTVDNNNNAFLTFAVTEETVKKKWSSVYKAKSVGLLFMHMDENGEPTLIYPALEERFYATDQYYYFNSKTNELVAVFITSTLLNEKDNESEGLGYNYYKWNLDGEVVQHDNHMFSMDDLQKAGLTDEFIKASGFKQSDILTKSNELKSSVRGDLHVKFQPDGSALVDINVSTRELNTIVKEITKSKIYFMISNEGSLQWLHFFPYTAGSDPHTNFFTNGQFTYVLTTEDKLNWDGKKYVFKEVNRGYNNNTHDLALRKIDLNTGELVYFKPIMDGVNSDLSYAGVSYSILLAQKTVIVQFSGKKNVKTRYKLEL